MYRGPTNGQTASAIWRVLDSIKYKVALRLGGSVILYDQFMVINYGIIQLRLYSLQEVVRDVVLLSGEVGKEMHLWIALQRF